MSTIKSISAQIADLNTEIHAMNAELNEKLEQRKVLQAMLKEVKRDAVDEDGDFVYDDKGNEIDYSELEEKPPVATKTKGASKVKRSKSVDKIVENVKGKRDVNAGDKARIDQAKAQDVKPAKVAQEKRTTKKAAAPKAEKAKKEKRTHNGMSYAETRKQVSERKAKLNKADQERMAKAGLKNNTWDGAIESLAWLDKYFPAK